MPYPPPVTVLGHRSLRPAFTWPVGFSLVVLLACPVGFALLPVSRRQARVRPRVQLNWYAIPVLAALPAALIWWSAASLEHLRIRHAWGVGASVVFVAFLATCLAFVLGWLALNGWSLG